jgi:hypothetical protein
MCLGVALKPGYTCCARYLTELHFLPEYKKGFWEKMGCHDRGRVALDERWNPRAHSIWTVLKVWCAQDVCAAVESRHGMGLQSIA